MVSTARPLSVDPGAEPQALVKPRVVGPLQTHRQWAIETRFIRRLRKRGGISAKTSAQVISIIRVGARIALLAEKVGAIREYAERVEALATDITPPAPPALGRLARVDGWLAEAGMIYRATWAGRLDLHEALLDTFVVEVGAQLNGLEQEAEELDRLARANDRAGVARLSGPHVGPLQRAGEPLTGELLPADVPESGGAL